MKARHTEIPGLTAIELDVHVDERGSFREAFHAKDLRELGLPELEPVQLNVSESRYGVIRGIHAEPWEKYIHVASGTAFAAIVDLRIDEPTFGQVETFELSTGQALWLPEGVGNSFAATSEELVYAYLVPEHWRVDAEYPAVAYDDPALGIDWPIPEGRRIVSDKDRQNPTLAEAFPDIGP